MTSFKTGDLVKNIFYEEKSTVIPPSTSSGQYLIGNNSISTVQIGGSEVQVRLSAENDIKRSNFGILKKNKKKIGGSFKIEEVKVPIVIDYWEVWCVDHIETWIESEMEKIS